MEPGGPCRGGTGRTSLGRCSGCISRETSGWAVFSCAPCAPGRPRWPVLGLSGLSELRQRSQCSSNPCSHQDFMAWPEPYCPGDLAHAQPAAFLGASLFPLLKSSYLEILGAPAWRVSDCKTSATCPELQLLLCRLRVHKCVSMLQMSAGIALINPPRSSLSASGAAVARKLLAEPPSRRCPTVAQGTLRSTCTARGLAETSPSPAAEVRDAASSCSRRHGAALSSE